MSTFIVNLAEKFILFEFSERGRAQFLSDHTPAKMRERINGNFRYHLAEADHELVGLAGIRDNAHLFHLFVAESLQCQGLGRRLWEYAVAECRKESNSGIFTVNSSKNAVAAYERLGFSVTGPMQNMNDVLFVPMQLAFL
ncbi:MAG: GNAT family N-acetyltransferase [Alphaproteobacteria bacterium]